MTPNQRLRAALDGRFNELDRLPNFNIVMFYSARYANQPFDAFCANHKVLVDANLKSAEMYGIDILSTMSDPVRETADFGTELVFPDDDLPHPKRVLLPEIEDVKKLELFDPLKSTRILDRINGIRLFKEKKGDDYPILGWVEGPLAEASDLRGINECLMDIIDEDNEELFHELLEKCTQQAILCAKAQIEAGAHIIGMGDAAVSLISRDMYRDIVLPYERRIVQAIQEAGGLARLHICGDINRIIEDIATLNFDIVDIDWMVDMKRSCEILDGISLVNGNIDPVSVMLEGTPADVKAAVRKCVDESNGRAIISAGCEIPKYTPHENLMAFTEALYECKK